MRKMMPIRIVGKYVWSVWKRMGNVWKMGQGVWNYSTIVCFAMQVIISNERMVVIQ